MGGLRPFGAVEWSLSGHFRFGSPAAGPRHIPVQIKQMFPSAPALASVCPQAFPTYSGAALGNPVSGWYDGVPGKPALLQNPTVCGGSGNEAEARLSDIVLTDPGGHAAH
jgi:hypothetical protein